MVLDAGRRALLIIQEEDWTLPPCPTLKIILMPSFLHKATSGTFLETLSPPFAKTAGRTFASVRQTLLSVSPFLWSVKTTRSTNGKCATISARSFCGMKTKPFFARSQWSLFMITTSLSPSRLASQNIRTCPMCSGSNPPETATQTGFFRTMAGSMHFGSQTCNQTDLTSAPRNAKVLQARTGPRKREGGSAPTSGSFRQLAVIDDD